MKYSLRGSVVGWGTMLLAGWSRVRFPMRSLNCIDLPNPSGRNMALGPTQPLTEMSTRNLPGGKGRPARKADNLTAICEPIVWKMWCDCRLQSCEVLTAAVMKSAIFWYIALYSPLKINRRFGGTYRLHLQDRISWARYQSENRWQANKTVRTYGPTLRSSMRRLLVGRCYADGVCFLWGTNWVFKYYFLTA
jgi:hypothetical protein